MPAAAKAAILKKVGTGKPRMVENVADRGVTSYGASGKGRSPGSQTVVDDSMPPAYGKPRNV